MASEAASSAELVDGELGEVDQLERAADRLVDEQRRPDLAGRDERDRTAQALRLLHDADDVQRGDGRAVELELVAEADAQPSGRLPGEDDLAGRRRGAPVQDVDDPGGERVVDRHVGDVDVGAGTARRSAPGAAPP